MSAYYNEFDPFAAAWLRELIKAGHIAQGDVDDRSILDVSAGDLRGYTQCHFFAGIGVWSYSLRRAGWSDDRPVWTGSCPCQPLSVAGLGKGHADSRHLWPAFHRLIAECRPAVVLGEQVAGKDGREWFAAVRADLEADGYACGGADLCAAGVGAPHIRQRLWWVGLADTGRELRGAPRAAPGSPQPGTNLHDQRRGADDGLADTDSARPQGRRVGGNGAGQRLAGAGGVAGGLAHATGGNARQPVDERGGGGQGGDPQGADQRHRGGGAYGGLANADGARPLDGVNGAEGRRAETTSERGSDHRPSADHGFWSDADWLYCRDDRWRPVEPGTFPLATGSPARVGRLRGYGNAICAPLAQAFIESVMDLTSTAEDPAPCSPQPDSAAGQ